MLLTRALLIPLLTAVLLFPTFGAPAATPAKIVDDLYGGWLKMYDLRFDEAHQSVARWQKTHAADSLGPVSQAAGYLFAELARLGALESELFVNDHRFEQRQKLRPDPRAKQSFLREIDAADRLADQSLEKTPTDQNALFAKSLALGLQADYAALIDKESLASLRFTKQARTYAEKVLELDPNAYDAYLGPGVENYLLSLKAAPLRFALQITGSHINKQKGIEELKLTAAHGHYLEPFAKLLLAVAALRDKDPAQAQRLLQELHDRFPGNPLYARELERLTVGTR